MKIKKGDTVQVITGKDKGKSGKVKAVFRNFDRVVVEGVNIVKKHKKSTKQGEPGGILEFEAPVHISNVMLLDPKKDKPTRIGFRVEKEGKVRIAKKSNSKI
jgi:large subunit ribosomal protein L24